jgi:hypothetical protein
LFGGLKTGDISAGINNAKVLAELYHARSFFSTSAWTQYVRVCVSDTHTGGSIAEEGKRMPPPLPFDESRPRHSICFFFFFFLYYYFSVG